MFTKIIKKLKALSILIIFTYQGKLVMSIVFVSLITFFLLISDRMMLMKEFVYERAMKRIESMSAVLINEVQENLLGKDIADLKTIIMLAGGQPDVRFISILNQDRGVQYSTDSGIEINKITYEDSRSIPSEKKDVFIKTSPLMGNNETVGYMQIGFSLKEIRADLRESLHWALWLDGTMLIFIVFIAWLVSGLLLRPLSEMKNVSMEIARGNFAARAHIRSPDIIGALAVALNEMAAQLGDLTGNMNGRIKEATYELEAKNKELYEKTCQLEAFNKQLMELDTLKSEFVSMVSHELRTPLTSIIGFSKTLLTLNLTDEQRKRYLSILHI